MKSETGAQVGSFAEEHSEAHEALLSARDFVRWGASCFESERLAYGHGTDNALDEALLLVAYALHLRPDTADAFWDCRITAHEKDRILELFRRRIEERVPRAYLTREAWFAGLSFYVDERVLVPRSPMAELIEAGFEPWLEGREPGTVLDLCTGSGCLAVACALAFPHAQVDATDLSSDALAVAGKNVERYGLGERLHLRRADVYDGLQEGRYDLIVSNPPYVPRARLEELPEEYRREPSLGLLAGDDGLSIVRRILAGAVERLSPRGLLVVEVGESRESLERAYPRLPFVWVDMQRGGEGIFLLTREQLTEAQGDSAATG